MPDTEREVRFGRATVSWPAGLLVDHWAIQVGDTWWEVVGPEGGPINQQPWIGMFRLEHPALAVAAAVLVVLLAFYRHGVAALTILCGAIPALLILLILRTGHSVGSNTEAEYEIRKTTGSVSASEAAPSKPFSVTLGWISAFWTMWMFSRWLARVRTWSDLSYLLIMLMLIMLPVLGGMVPRAILPWIGLGHYAHHVSSAIVSVWSLQVITSVLAMPFRGASHMEGIAAVGVMAKYWHVVKIIIFLMYCYGIIVCLYDLFLIVCSWRRGDITDPRSASVLGTTTLTDTEITEFSYKYKQENPVYLGFTTNCQHFSSEIVAELLKNGTKFQDLPMQESPVEKVLPIAICLYIFLY